MELTVFPNLEMGDNIVLNGMARYLAARELGVVNWVVRATYFEAIKLMFSDVRNIRVIDGYDYPEIRVNLIPKAERKILMGFFTVPESKDWQCNSGNWDQQFYHEAGVDFEHRWLSFNLPDSLKPGPAMHKPGLEGCALLHDIPERGMVIDPKRLPVMPTLRITRGPSFWDWISWIYSVAELHFIDSAYLNLAESLYAIGLLRSTKLVFHSYVKKEKHGSTPPILRAPWIIL